MIDFNESMKMSSSKMNSNEKWNILRDLYDKNINHTNITNIPKIFHQIWLGSEYPEKYKILKDKFIEKNPDWEFKIWNDEDAERFNMINQKQFNTVANLGTKSDIFRYEILYRYGGVYIDTDFLCLKSFNDLTHLDFFAGTGHLNEPEFFNGLIGCKKENSFILKLIEEISLKIISEKNYDEILKMTGPSFISNLFFENISNHINSVILPCSYFYPLPAIHRHLIRNNLNNTIEKFILSYAKEETFCIHLWYTSWQK